MNNEDELFMRCVQLDLRRYELEDKIEEILDFLLHTHITIEEYKELQEIVNRKDEKYEQVRINR